MKQKPGHVYLIQGRGSNLTKIGMTRNLPRRIKLLQAGSPIRLEVIALFHHEDPEALECMLHLDHRSRHIFGEWFQLTEKHIELIRKMLKPYAVEGPYPQSLMRKRLPGRMDKAGRRRIKAISDVVMTAELLAEQMADLWK
jgi:hypothetical protein